MALKQDRKHLIRNGIYDFLGESSTFSFSGVEVPLELDYVWDWTSDPVITPTIVHEWKHLNDLLATKVLKGKEIVMSLGGGGTSQTHEYLDPRTKEFYIVNPGMWDLENAALPGPPTSTFLVRAIGEDLPFLNDSADAIEVPATLDHMVSPEEALTECLRILRPGGKVGITLGNSESWYRLFVKKTGIKIDDHHEHAHSHHFSPKKVEELLTSIGYVNVHTIGSSYLKLPKSVERGLKGTQILKIHSFLSNMVLRRVFGDYKGGMFLTYGEKA